MVFVTPKGIEKLIKVEFTYIIQFDFSMLLVFKIFEDFEQKFSK